MRWRWFRIVKNLAGFPKTGSYKAWKSQLAEEGRSQCVYCTIHESSFGGTWNFHVEHYRPKARFAELVNNFANLFYACAICNVFKGDDWPGEPQNDYSSPFYPDPSEVDYCDFLDVDPESGLVTASTIAGRYIIEKLYLNRPQLILERRRFHMFEKLESLSQDLRALSAELGRSKGGQSQVLLLMGGVVDALTRITELQARARELRPYVPDDVRRPSNQ